jgi:hypothetical protein
MNRERWRRNLGRIKSTKKKGGPGLRRDPPDLSPSRISKRLRSLP